MANSLNFNISEIGNMRKKVKTTAADLRSFKTTLLKEIEILKKNWNTPAGKKFTSEVNTDWATQVDQYVKILGAVDELLIAAETEYKKVENSAKALSF